MKPDVAEVIYFEKVLTMAGRWIKRASGFKVDIGSSAVVAILAAFIVIVMGAWQIDRAYDALLSDVERDAQNLGHALSQQAARTIDGIDLILFGAKERMAFEPDPAQLKPYLERRLAQAGQILDLVVYDSAGLLFANGAREPLHLHVAAADYFQSHREHADQGLFFGEMIRDEGTGAFYIPVSRRLDRADGSFAGIVVAMLKPEWLQNFYKSIQIGPNGAITLLNISGRILARYPSTSSFVNADPDRTALAAKRFEPRSGVVRSTSIVDGVERIFAFNRVEAYPLVVVAAIAVSDALVDWHREALYEAVVLAIISSLLVTMGLGLETQRRRVAKQMQSSAEADARYKLLADNSSDMIQHLDLRGVRTYVSPASTGIFGYSPDELIGTDPRNFVHGQDLPRFREMLDAITVGVIEEARSIHRIIHKRGHEVWVEVQFRLVRDCESRAPATIVSNLRDITARETLQRALQRAYTNLCSAEEVAHVGHWRVEMLNKELFWSDEVFRIHGLDPAGEVPSIENAILAYHPDDRAEVERCMQDALTERGTFEFKLRLQSVDGGERHVVSRGHCEIDAVTDKVTALFGTVMDVTELTLAERTSSEKSALLEATLQTMDQGLIKIAADGTIELANRRFHELLGIRASSTVDLPPHARTIFDGSDPEHLAPPSPPHPRTGADVTTFDYHRPDGVVLEVRDVSIDSGAFVRTYADITGRRKAEAELRESEARYRFLAETTSDLITRLKPDFKRDYVSPASLSILGYTPDELLGTVPSSWMHPDDAERVHLLAVAMMAGEIEGDRSVVTYRARHKRGHWIWLEAAMRLVRDETTGASSSLTCSIRDVSERQQAAALLEDARAKAEKAGQVKAEFLANMSHELRTPLTGILGVHELLQSSRELSDEHRRLVALASEAGRSLLAIVNDILDFSKIEAQQLTIERVAFSAKALVAGCCDLAIKGLGGKKIEILCNVPDDLPTCLMGDPTRIRQVVLNLLTNATKFTACGTIEVKASYHAASGIFRLSVADSGIGIAADKMECLFDRFSQADASVNRQYGGTGLGLAICKRLVELMSGRIGVESVEGEGSTFWFEIPLSVQVEPMIAAPVEFDRPRPSRRVLLADDNLMNREIISAVLADFGYAVTSVGDGKAAVDAAAPGCSYDVVLMDVQMPIMDGYTATRLMRQRECAHGSAPLPIIGLTASALSEDVELCLTSGMNAHAAKPIDWKKLTDLMEECCVS